MWLTYVRDSKYEKVRNIAAVSIQLVARMYILKCKVKAAKTHAMRIYYFFKMAVDCFRWRRKLKSYIEKDFESWLPSQLLVRTKVLQKNEEKRLLAEKKSLADNEKNSKIEILDFLSKSDGLLQVQILAQEKINLEGKQSFGEKIIEKVLKKSRLLDEYCEDEKNKIIESNALLSRQLENHNFYAKNPPIIICPSPHCRAVCMEEKQYLNHIMTADLLLHSANFNGTKYQDQSIAPINTALPDLPNITVKNDTTLEITETEKSKSHYHGKLKNSERSLFADFRSVMFSVSEGEEELFRTFVVRTQGMGSHLNCFDAWRMIQTWRQCVSGAEGSVLWCGVRPVAVIVLCV